MSIGLGDRGNLKHVNDTKSKPKPENSDAPTAEEIKKIQE
jgi:hypothetical protein